MAFTAQRPSGVLLGHSVWCGGDGETQSLHRPLLCTHSCSPETGTSITLKRKKGQNKHLALPYHVAFIITIITVLSGVIHMELVQQQTRRGLPIAVLVLGGDGSAAVHAASPVQGRHLQCILEVEGAFRFQRLHAMRQRAIEAAGPAGALLIRALPFLRALLPFPGEEGPALAALPAALEAGGSADAVPAGAAAVPAAAGAPGAVRGAAGAGLREGQGEHQPCATRPVLVHQLGRMDGQPHKTNGRAEHPQEEVMEVPGT